MKNCSVMVAFLLVLALTGYNSWQIRALRSEVHRLQEEVRRQEKSSSLVTEALHALQQARDALARTDTKGAGAALERARSVMTDLTGKAAPAARWLQEQISGVAKQLDAQKSKTP